MAETAHVSPVAIVKSATVRAESPVLLEPSPGTMSKVWLPVGKDM